jgi:hypothetical protein
MKYLISGIILLSSYTIQAQDNPADSTEGWKVEGKAGLLFNQVALTNWVAGGTNSVAGGVTFDLNFNRKQDKWQWNNALALGLGYSKQGEDPVNKTDDRILFNTNLAYELNKTWSAAGNANFRTQFVNGYDLPNDSVSISTFMAPAYLVVGAGVQYRPNEFFVVELDPVSNKTLFVLDDQLAANGAFGVDSAKNVRAEFGAFLQMKFKKEIVKNITLDTYLTLFSNYLVRPEKIDVNWDLTIDFKINEWFSANFMTQLIFDDDIRFAFDSTGDGVNDADESRVQFRQALGVGFVAKF